MTLMQLHSVMSGDGYTYCTTDCDDADATLNGDDLDMDGYSTCDGDCDDTPGSCDDGSAQMKPIVLQEAVTMVQALPKQIVQLLEPRGLLVARGLLVVQTSTQA